MRCPNCEAEVAALLLSVPPGGVEADGSTATGEPAVVMAEPCGHTLVIVGSTA